MELKQFCQHHFNTLHIYCKLIDFGVDKKKALRVSSRWEIFTHKFLYGEFKMRNVKTTVSGLVIIASQSLSLIGIPVPENIQHAMLVIGVFMIGCFAKDGSEKY